MTRLCCRTLLAGLLLVHVSCRSECESTKEPELLVSFSRAAPNFTRIYALSNNQDVPRRDTAYYLPLSLLTDSVTYVFQTPDRTDTLTVFYRRNFYFQSEGCGFVAAIERDSIRQTDTRTTFAGADVDFFRNELYLY